MPQADAPYAKLLHTLPLQLAERLVLILSLIPHIKPTLLDTFFVRNQSLDRGYTEFGGLRGDAHSGFLPTCETAMFLLADDNLAARLHHDGMVQRDHHSAHSRIQRALRAIKVHYNKRYLAN